MLAAYGGIVSTPKRPNHLHSTPATTFWALSNFKVQGVNVITILYFTILYLNPLFKFKLFELFI